MPTTSTITIIEKTRPQLIAEARRMRERGDSFEAIAFYLTKKVRVHIGRETVRRWFVAQEQE